MKFEEYEIVAISPEIKDIFSIRLKPKGKKHISTFRPGQFYHMRNPGYSMPNETRQFSIITTPKIKDYMDFSIKTYGPWTKALFEKKPGDSVWLFGPMGEFTLKKTKSETVFIAGGVGITPILSIIQHLHEKKSKNNITLIYANKSSQNILKKAYIKNLFQTNQAWKLIFLISQLDQTFLSDERHGYITDELIRQEINLNEKLLFFVCGSNRFTQNITTLLQGLGIPDSRIKKEVFIPPYPNRGK